jgi:stage III sporulation protein AH
LKNVFKRNQIVITALAIMIAAAFYLNYADKIDTSEPVAQTSAKVNEGEIDVSDISDEDVYSATNTETNSEEVLDALSPNGEEDIESYDLDLTSDTPKTTDSASATDAKDQTASKDATTETAQTTAPVTGTDTPGEAVLTSATTNVGFIAEAKLSREQVRAKNKEALLDIINNTSISDTQKQAAIDAMIKMTDIAEREAAAETLLESKGFEDVVVSITDDTADVVINMAEVTDAKRAQIEDIMKRKTGVSAENIVITPISVEK